MCHLVSMANEEDGPWRAGGDHRVDIALER
jgi:hypothetical protein